MADDTYVIPLWGPRCTGELHGKETSSHQIHAYLAPFPYNGGNIDAFVAAYVFPKKLCVSQDAEINLPYDRHTFPLKQKHILHANSHKREC